MILHAHTPTRFVEVHTCVQLSISNKYIIYIIVKFIYVKFYDISTSIIKINDTARKYKFLLDIIR